MARPQDDEIDTAMDVLLWLYEITDDGKSRDEISYVRYLLEEAQEET